MKIYPAIDLYGGCAVRLLRGNYNDMTVYDRDPLSVARRFRDAGTECLHLVDLEGARDGGTPNIDVIRKIVGETALFTEVGGGIRDFSVIETYLAAGVARVILGTAAVTQKSFAAEAVRRYGDKIAVGADIRDGHIAIHGWTENSALGYETFLDMLSDIGVSTVICTDISRDGAMRGANLALYRELSEKHPAMGLIASGGVSSLDDVRALAAAGLAGAVIGKAYYTGALDIGAAVEAAG